MTEPYEAIHNRLYRTDPDNTDGIRLLPTPLTQDASSVTLTRALGYKPDGITPRIHDMLQLRDVITLLHYLNNPGEQP